MSTFDKSRQRVAPTICKTAADSAGSVPENVGDDAHTPAFDSHRSCALDAEDRIARDVGSDCLVRETDHTRK